MNDEALAAAFVQRRPEALAVAYDRYAKLLYSAAYAVLQNSADAEDCVHDSLLSLWKKTRAFMPWRGNLRSFLVVCVRNAAISKKRAQVRHSRIEDVHALAAEEREPFDPFEHERLARALALLPAEQRDPLRLAYDEHLTQTQIAQQLSIPLGTVKSRISLAMKKLRDALEVHHESH